MAADETIGRPVQPHEGRQRNAATAEAMLSSGPRRPRRWLGPSSNSGQIFPRNSSENIQFDDPETVISAVREEYNQIKRR
jgi:hypothetical protein